MRLNPWTALLLLAALGGFAFASVSTYDFVAHLDRQVHGIHCSFLPGLAAAETGQTGCHATLMSPYSSIWRESIWGGLPISLPAMSVFAFLVFWAAWLVLRDRQSDVRATGFTLLATLLPALTSVVMAYISLAQLDAACKLCIGIYISSFTALFAAFMLWSDARRGRPFPGQGQPQEPLAHGVLGLAFGLGVLFVAVPVTAYALSAPDFGRYVGKCGQLAYATDPQLLVPLGPQARSVSIVEVLDPLCPSCRGFETRFAQMEAHETVSRQGLLFPLDNTCNWMVGESIHPGACAISETMLCAGDRADQVLTWAFENQEPIMEATRRDAKAAQRMAGEHFPDLARCIGSPAVRARLNLVLRFAVKNRLQVLTPQVFVQGLRLCDEDSDLGLDYALPRLVERARLAPLQLPALPKSHIAPAVVQPRAAAAPRPASTTATPTAVAPAQPTGSGSNTDASPPEPPTPAPPVPPEPPEPTGEAAQQGAPTP